MKHILHVTAVVTALTATPALSGNLADPVLEQELIIAEAEADSKKLDLLMVTIALATLFGIAGSGL